MSLPVLEYGDPIPITNASVQIAVPDGVLLGIVVSTSTAGVITITESRANGRAITSVMPLTAGTFVPIKAKFVGPLTLLGGGAFVATAIVL